MEVSLNRIWLVWGILMEEGYAQCWLVTADQPYWHICAAQIHQHIKTTRGLKPKN